MQDTFYDVTVRANVRISAPHTPLYDSEGTMVGLTLADGSVVKFWLAIEAQSPIGEDRDLSFADAVKLGIEVVEYDEHSLTPDPEVL